ncbi:MAG: hypothetical protein H7326_01710, partial [Bdellovibrionaceae bacterium]|nr:hypothetical protein [Pseudobdellovibrionaceae bacterium]
MSYADIINAEGIEDPKELKRCMQVIYQSAISQAQVIITQVDLRKIFDFFMQADSTVSRKYGGSIHADNKGVGQGSKFTFRL